MLIWPYMPLNTTGMLLANSFIAMARSTTPKNFLNT